jgi:DNA-binding LacI/PurR family transcriptional regulator
MTINHHRLNNRGAKNKRTTIHSVAARAGVSTSTVSRVMNGSGYVSDESARSVWNAIRELDYAPDPAAKALAQRRNTK